MSEGWGGMRLGLDGDVFVVVVEVGASGISVSSTTGGSSFLDCAGLFDDDEVVAAAATDLWLGLRAGVVAVVSDVAAGAVVGLASC